MDTSSLTQQAQSGISFDPSLFDADFFDQLDSIDMFDIEDTVTLDPMLMATAPPQDEPLTEAQTQDILEQAWRDLLDSELGAEIRRLPPVEQAKLHKIALTPPPLLTPEAAGKITLTPNPVEVPEHGDTLIVAQGNSPLMAAPLGAKGSAEKAKKAAFFVAAATVLVDVFAMAAAAAGVMAAMNQRAMKKMGIKVATTYTGALSKNAKGIAEISKASKLIALQRSIGIAKAVAGFPKLAAMLFTDMSLLDKAAACATAGAGLALAIATGGAAFWAIILAMGAAVLSFLADTVTANQKWHDWKG